MSAATGASWEVLALVASGRRQSKLVATLPVSTFAACNIDVDAGAAEEADVLAPLHAGDNAFESEDVAATLMQGRRWKQRARDVPRRSHIVLLVDVSGSMRTPDVVEDGVGTISRFDAAERCLRLFLEDRARTSTSDVFSAATFSDKSDVLARALPALHFLQSCCLPARSCGGTSYRAAIGAALELLPCGPPGTAPHVVLLSDGAPGDAKGALELFQKRFLKKHPNARVHGIGFGATDRDFASLQQLTSLSGGSFTMSSCSFRSLAQAFSNVSSTITSLTFGTSGSWGSALLVHESTPLHEAPARRTWRAVTFEQPYARTCGRKGVLQFRAVRTSIKFHAIEAEMDHFEDLFWEEASQPRLVARRERPYSRGAMRLVYGFQDAPKSVAVDQMVAKVSRFADDKLNSREVVETYVKSTAVASHYANLYNQRVPGRKGHPSISFLPCFLYEVTGDPMEEYPVHEPKYFAAEGLLPGAFLKYTSNAGYIGEDTLPHNDAVQAFTHFTFSESGGALLVADLQGVVRGDGVILTDPQVLSRKVGAFGPGDLGEEGMQRCLAAHRCGATCRKLGFAPIAASVLRRLGGQRTAGAPQGRAESGTSSLGSGWHKLAGAHEDGLAPCVTSVPSSVSSWVDVSE